MGLGQRALWALAMLVCLTGCKFGGPERARTAAATPPLIARETLFGLPEHLQVQVSPDGRSLSFLAPRNGAMGLWMAPVSAPSQARLLSDEGDAPIVWHAWSADGRSLLFLRAVDEDRQVLLSVATAGGPPLPLTPESGARLRVLNISPKDPAAVLVAIAEDAYAAPDVYSINVRNAERALVYRNDRGFADFWADQSNALRLGRKVSPTGDVQFWARPAAGGDWAVLLKAAAEDAPLVRPLAFDAAGRTFLMLDSIGRDRAALVRVSAATGEKTVLGESPRADVAKVWLNAANFEPQAFAAQYLKLDWQPLSPEGKADIDYLNQRLDGDPLVVSRSRDDGRWIVLETAPTVPTRAYVYDRRDGRSLRFLFALRPQLASEPLQPMIPLEINARDGLTLVSYLTLPPNSDLDGNGRPERAQPLVLLVHDGPGRRDGYAFRADHQWLANRGYAVLSVNFRGSSGFGKAFGNGGDRPTGSDQQQDLLDAVDWAVSRQIALPDKVAIFGESAGGDAALLALSKHPEVFSCGVAAPAVAQPDETAAPAYRWEATPMSSRPPRPQTTRPRVLSPVRALQIEKPFLLVQGGQDSKPRRALREQAHPDGTLALATLPNEGGRMIKHSNALAVRALTEQFLAGCLQGRAEPFRSDLLRSDLKIETGADFFPGLDAAEQAGR